MENLIEMTWLYDKEGIPMFEFLLSIAAYDALFTVLGRPEDTRSHFLVRHGKPLLIDSADQSLTLNLCQPLDDRGFL